jgi:hypothetical protein
MYKSKIKLYKKYFYGELDYAYMFDIGDFIKKYKKQKLYRYSEKYYFGIVKKLKPLDRNDFPKNMNQNVVHRKVQENNIKIIQAIYALKFFSNKQAKPYIENIYKIAQTKEISDLYCGDYYGLLDACEEYLELKKE